MIGRVRESRNPKKVIRITLMESYGEIGQMPVNLFIIEYRLASLEANIEGPLTLPGTAGGYRFAKADQ